MGIWKTITDGISQIAPVIPLAGAAVDALSQSSTNKANMNLAKYQNAWNYDMWQKQNEYNTPLAQMQRLKDAGLNPNLVYQNGADNTAASPSRADVPHLQAYTGFSNAANNMVNSLVTHAQIENLQEQNNILRIDAKAREQAIREKELDMQRKALENRGLEEDYPYLRSYQQWHTQNEESNSRLKESEIYLNMMRNDLTKAQMNEVIQRTETEYYNTQIRKHENRDYEELGLRPSDPIWVRMIANALLQMFPKGKVLDLLNGVMR